MRKLYLIQHLENSDSKATLISEKLSVAESFLERAKGLLGRNSLELNETLWIKPCNNIHTFFMKFNIDCIFINRSMQIEKIYASVPPFRIIGPVWKSFSIIEAPAGFCEKWNLKKGDRIHVVS